MSISDQTTVYFDGSCPLCVREIAIYKNSKSTDVAFIDVSAVDYADNDLDQAKAMARFHVRQADGTLLDGGEAFIALWAKTPGFKWLAALFKPSFMVKIANVGYDKFLRIRPAIQWLFGKRKHDGIK